MNDQNQPPVKPETAPPLIQPTPPNLPDPVAKDMDKLKSILLIIKSKFNKKVLIMIAMVFGVFLFLLILISLISKNIRKIVNPANIPTSTPEVSIDSNPQATVSSELVPEQNQLESLKEEINNLDIKQSRLKPPNVNFKIDFEAKK